MSGRRRPRVVVGVSDSLAGMQALRYAVSEARRRECGLTAVRAWQFQVPWRGSDVDRWRSDAEAAAEEVLYETFASALGGVPNDISVEPMVVEGAPAPTLVTLAYLEQDLLVIGTPTRRLFRPARFTVAHHCVRHAQCPVVVVPPPELARTRRHRSLAREIHREVRRLVDTSS